MERQQLQQEIDELRIELNERLKRHSKRGEYLYTLKCCEAYIDHPSVEVIIKAIRQLIQPINLR